MMKKICLLIFLLSVRCAFSYAQDYNQIVFPLQDDFQNIDTLPQAKKFRSAHKIGVKYSYEICNVNCTPNVGQKAILSPVNVTASYTYHSALWDYINIFGLQINLKYGKQGYSSPYNEWGEINDIAEGQLLSQLHLDAGMFSILLNIGPYYAYRLATDKEGGFDQYDIRHDYGIFGGGGIALKFNRFELQFEGGYKYALCSMYHTNKYSDLYWVLAYPKNISISAGIHYTLW